MSQTHQFVRVEFHRFKAFEEFTLRLHHLNILVGPNNAGKSTILAAFRILAAAIRRAASRNPEIVRGQHGETYGYKIDLSAISVAEENIFFNYDDSEPAHVAFALSNKNTMTLFFPEQRSCFLVLDAQGRSVLTTSAFKSNFNCPIGFVPILGPVEHNEKLYEKEAARLALFTYGAARNFRNIWYHYPEKFAEFRSVLMQTWPGMDIERPTVDFSHSKPRLHMFCPEERIPREIFWAGFGFQVWCQMLTHVIQANELALFLIDEPDIYLHADLQRQLLGILRTLGPDILIATHSTEMIMEAEADDIVLIDKKRKHARRINNPSQLQEVFGALGSNLNPILTQLAKTRRALFVEGKDFQILGKFARKLGFNSVANRSDFTVIPVEGFSPERIRSLKRGIETTLGGKIIAAALLDRDYRSGRECEKIASECKAFCDFVFILESKEIENLLLVPAALDRAITRRIADVAERTGRNIVCVPNSAAFFENYATAKKTYLAAQHLEFREHFERATSPGKDKGAIKEEALNEFERRWDGCNSKLKIIPGKEAVGALNRHLQESCGVSITPTAIIDSMRMDEIPEEARILIRNIAAFASEKPSSSSLR